MPILIYLNQLLRDEQFWFLKESAMDFWLLSQDPKALPYIAIAYYCLDEDTVGRHWLQRSRKSLNPEQQQEVFSIMAPHAPKSFSKKVNFMLHELAYAG